MNRFKVVSESMNGVFSENSDSVHIENVSPAVHCFQRELRKVGWSRSAGCLRGKLELSVDDARQSPFVC